MANSDKKGLAIVTKDPDLAEWKSKLDDLNARAASTKSFLVRERDALNAKIERLACDFQTEADQYWKAFEEHLKARGILPESYKKDESTLGFDGDVLYMREDCDCGEAHDDVKFSIAPVPKDVVKLIKEMLKDSGI